MEPEQMPGPPHGDDKSTRMGRVGGQAEQKYEGRDLSRPAFPRAAERAGVTTSAMSRDGARLRTVMTRAAEQNVARAAGPDADEWRAEQEVAYGAAHSSHDHDAPSRIPMPELEAAGQDAGADARADHAGYRATRLVTPQSDRLSSTYAAAASGEEARDATRLRPVTSLEEFKPAPESPAATPPESPAGNQAPREYEWKGPASERRAAANVAGDPTREDVWDAAAAATTPKVASDRWTGADRRRERGNGGFRKGATAALTMMMGTAVAIALYAGGSGFLSDFFSNKNEGVAVNVSPSAVTERPQSAMPATPSAPPAGTVASDSSRTADSLLAARYDRYAVEDRADVAEGEILPAKPAPEKTPAAGNLAGASASKPGTPPKKSPEPPRPAAATAMAGDAGKTKADAQNKEKQGAKKDEKGAEIAKKEPAAPSTGKYVVQVRATSDESEANLIAKKLRKKGISNVQIVKSEKNGAPFFRIRFTSAGTGSEAQAKAKSAGFSDAWVVQQK